MSEQSSPALYSEDDFLPISALADLVFCERRAALHHIERVWEDNLLTAEGTLLHERVDAQELTEARGDLRISRGLRLRSLRLGLTGMADVVEFHRVEECPSTSGVRLEGVDGLWQPFIVEYKRGHLRHEEGYEIQLCAQALCLEEMLHVEIASGCLFYGKTRRRLDVAFNEELRGRTEAATTHLHQLIKAGVTPKAVREPKCEQCSLVDLCLPSAMLSRRTVRGYLSQAIAEAEEGTR